MRALGAAAALLALCATSALARSDGSAVACHNTTSKSQCLTTEACVFCQATLVPSGCFLDSEAKLLPGFMYNCTNKAGLRLNKPKPGPGPQPGPQPGGGCPTLKAKKDCTHSKDSCVWCTASFGSQESCYSADQAKWLPASMFSCTKPKKPSDAEVADDMLEKGKKHDNKHDKKDDDDKKKDESCRDIKERKACVKSKAVCSWCEGKIAPGASMCADETTAKFLPPMVFECEKSKRSDDDDKPSAALTLDLVAKKGKKKGGDDGPGGGGQPPSCRDIKERKACVKSKAVCSWCEGQYGQPMCADEAQAKYLPPSVFKCEKSKRGGDDDDDAPYSLFSTTEEEEEDMLDKGKKKDDDDKKDVACTDIKERKACRKAKAVCSWCEGKIAPGASMCIDEAQAKFIPPMVFDCKKSKRSPDDDKPSEDEALTKGHGKKKGGDDGPGGGGQPPSCRDIKERKACVKSKAVCSWCEGQYGQPMCAAEAQAKYLPPSVFKCEKSKRAGGDDDAPYSLFSTEEEEEDEQDEQEEQEEQDDMLSRGGKGHGKGHKKHDKKDDKDRAVKDCRGLKGRGDCLHNRAVCSWCQGMFMPSMCLNETQTRYLPPVVFNCEPSKHSKGGKGGKGKGGGGSDQPWGPQPGPWGPQPWGPPSTKETAENEVVNGGASAGGGGSMPGPQPWGPQPGPWGPQPAGKDKCSGRGKRKCGDSKGCRWCSGMMTQGQCYTEGRAKMLPPYMFTCDTGAAKNAGGLRGGAFLGRKASAEVLEA